MSSKSVSRRELAKEPYISTKMKMNESIRSWKAWCVTQYEKNEIESKSKEIKMTLDSYRMWDLPQGSFQRRPPAALVTSLWTLSTHQHCRFYAPLTTHPSSQSAPMSAHFQHIDQTLTKVANIQHMTNTAINNEILPVSTSGIRYIKSSREIADQSINCFNLTHLPETLSRKDHMQPQKKKKNINEKYYQKNKYTGNLSNFSFLTRVICSRPSVF